MGSAAEGQQAGIGQFFDPGVLIDKLSQEFERLDTQWNKTRSHNGKVVRKKPVLSEENYLVDLQKARQVIDLLVDVLGSYFETPLFELEGEPVVESHPAIEQLRALSTALRLIRRSEYAENFPYSIITKGHRFNCSQKLHIRRLIGLIDRIKSDSNVLVDKYNEEKGRRIIGPCTTLDACQILFDNVKVKFKNKSLNPKNLQTLYNNHGI